MAEFISASQNDQEMYAILKELSVTDAVLEKIADFTDEMVEEIYSFAYAYYGEGSYKEAETIFRVLTALRIKSPKYWKGLGATFQMQKKYEEAIESYGWAALHDNSFLDPYPHFHAAECLYSSGNIPKALMALRSAEAVAKKNSFQSLLAQIRYLQKIWKEQK